MIDVALDVADEVARAATAPRARPGARAPPDDQRRALDRLAAVGQQRDARALDAEDRRRQRRAHERELHEVLGADLGVGADVEQRDRRAAAGTGQRDRQRRAVDALARA